MGYIDELRKLVGTRPIIMAGAGVFILNRDNRLLLLYRTDNDTWSIPGGSLDLGETLEECARREVKEETGLDVGALELLGVYSGPDFYYRYPNGDEVYNVSIAYICRDVHGEIDVDPHEHRALRYFPLDQIPEPISPPVRPILADFLKKVCADP